MTDQMVGVRFEYARSDRGIPQMILDVDTRIADSMDIRELIRSFVEGLEVVGAGHHKEQSMPSLDPGDYILYDTENDRVIESLAQASLKGDPYDQMYDTCTGWFELVYVGGFGPFQERQARRLGGRRGVEVARREADRGRELAARLEAAR